MEQQPVGTTPQQGNVASFGEYTVDYTPLEVDDSATQHRPLLLSDDDDDSAPQSEEESMLYRLPSEGGSIFSSFVSYNLLPIWALCADPSA